MEGASRLPNWYNAVVDKHARIAQFQAAVSLLHNCRALWRETVPVHEIIDGKTVWQCGVEVFDLYGHPRAKCAYAWSHLDGERFVALLAIPPVNSPEAAVRFQIMKDFSAGKK